MSITETKCDSPLEALERFEEAAKAFGLVEQFEGTIAYAIAYNAKQEAKQELLTWMSYIP